MSAVRIASINRKFQRLANHWGPKVTQPGPKTIIFHDYESTFFIKKDLTDSGATVVSTRTVNGGFAVTIECDDWASFQRKFHKTATYDEVLHDMADDDNRTWSWPPQNA